MTLKLCYLVEIRPVITIHLASLSHYDQFFESLHLGETST